MGPPINKRSYLSPEYMTDDRRRFQLPEESANDAIAEEVAKAKEQEQQDYWKKAERAAGDFWKKSEREAYKNAQ